MENYNGKTKIVQQQVQDGDFTHLVFSECVGDDEVIRIWINDGDIESQ